MYVVPNARETCCASSSARLADGVRTGGSLPGWLRLARDSISCMIASGSAPAAASRRRTGSWRHAAHSR